MSYFDDASLVMIPSGYKTSKVYSVKPTDGTGDLAFTRSNDTATRVGPDGLIEKVRTNLILQSETFDNASWTKSNASITANSIANPVNGATTAETLTFTGASAAKYLLQNNTISGSYSQSVYFKYSTHQWMQLFQSGDGAFSANFDIQNGVLGSYNGCTPSIVSVGSGWYRCTITFASTTATQFVIWAIDSGTDSRATNSASTGSVYIFGAQMEVSDFGATDYIATTSAAVSVGPVANVPRLDYLNSSCPRLLLEPQRTNIITYSEQFDNGAWTKTDVATTANSIASPDGYTNADLFTTNNAAGTVYRAYHSSTGGTDATNTISGFFKYGNHPYAYITADYIGVGKYAVFNVQTGVITFTSTGYTSTITDYGNGWYRCTLTGTMDSVNNIQFGLSTSATAYAGTSLANGKTLYVWGAQREYNVSYATSYIPTLGAAVTRGADAASKAGISSLIGQTEGTLFLDFEKKTNGAGEPIWLSDGTYNNYIYIGDGGSALSFQGVASSAQWSIASGALTNGRHKVAAAYKQNDIVLYIDGVQIGTDTSANIPTCSLLGLGYENGTIYNNANPYNQVLLFKTRLSNADLAALTA